MKNIIFEEIDGADPSKISLRNMLFDIARSSFFLIHLSIGQQGGKDEYPLLFVMRNDKTISFIGNWDQIQDLLDAESIDKSLLEQHPEIMTLSEYFA